MKLSKLTVCSLLSVTVIPFFSMADNTGTIDFIGSVVNTPCNIEQSSLKQTVDFGQLSRKALESGKAAEANFDIKLLDCDFENFGEVDVVSGKPSGVKTMELVFTGQNYVNGGEMLSTSTGNANNLGIEIEGFKFGVANDVLPTGNTQGDLILSFKALAKAIDKNKSVSEGKFTAVSNFRITYQ